MKSLLFLSLLFLGQPLSAGTASLFSDNQAGGSAQGSGSIDFNAYNAASITISVQAYAYGGSQQGGGRNYSGSAEAFIGPLRDQRTENPGSDPMSIGASISITVTKQSDGSWAGGGVNFGSGVSVGASAYVDGENSVGGASVSASVSWVEAPINRAPSISWSAMPGTAGSGQSYSITAHGHDADGNLAQVNVWKNGAPFAFAGGGNGTDGDSGNPTSDFGPATITFTANAVDSGGLTSATISQAVTITASNSAPTITWTSIPGFVANGQNYTVSAHGHDADGNLTQVNIWKDGVPYAFAGGGNGTDGDSGNPTTDYGPATVTFTANAVDSIGVSSGTISQTVSIGAPPSVSAWINVSPTSETAPGSVSVTWSSANATAVSVSGQGVGSSSTSGSQLVGGMPAGSYTYTITAHGYGGPVTQTATVTINPPADTAPTISWITTPGNVASSQSYNVSAHGHDADGNLTEVNIWRNGVPYAFAGGGNGTDGDSGNPSTDTGPLTVIYTAESVDANGARSGLISQTVTINAPPPVSAAITASPTNGAAPGSTTISWSSLNASAVSVTGTGLTSSAPSGSQTVSGLPAGTHTYAVTAQGAGGPVTQTVTFTVSPPANLAPTISWNTTPGTVASGQSYTVSAHGHDPDGNLTEVNVWRNGAPYAFAGGGNGMDGDSGNPSTDTGPLAVNYTAEAVDSNGARSGTISQTVTVTAPPAVAGSISASPTATTAPGSASITWSTSNATSVSVAGSGLSSTASSGSQTVSGLVAGSYTYMLMAQGPGGPVTQSATITVTAAASVSASIGVTPSSAAAPAAATITWSSANAAAVSVSGPGLSSAATMGSQSVSGLSAGIHTYTITAQGPNGPASETATVTVSAAPNSAPTIAWTSTPGIVASGQSYIVSAHGHDPDGNLTNVNVWRDGVPYAFAGGGNGTDNDSGNPSTDSGPRTVVYTAEAMDGAGLRSATISQTVTISAPATVAASIGASPTTATAPSSTTITWSSVNATAVSVSGNGLASSAASGSQLVSGLPAGSHTYTITAQGPGGPVTQSATFTVTAAASVSASISATPSSAAAPAAATIAWSSANATAVTVSGPGLSSAATVGSQSISGLPAGIHTYTITAQGPNGPASDTATVTVSAAPNSAPTIAWTSTPGTVASGQNYTVSAHGHDPDGNLTSVNVWRNGVPYSFAGGGNGTDNDSGNPSTDSGPLTVVYTAEAMDAAGLRSATISQTVTVTAPPAVSGSISASPTATTAPGSATITWSTANATSASVAGSGLSSTASSGSQTVSGLAAGSYVYTLTAEGPGGPITRSVTINVTASESLSGSLAAIPAVIYSNQSTSLSWTTTGTGFRWVHGDQPGLNGVNVYPAAVTGSTTVSGLPPGNYRFVIEYGPGSTATQMAFVDLTVLGVIRTVTTSTVPVAAGTVVGGGTYLEGTLATVSAAPDATHVFIGWSGDLSTTANPLGFTVGAQNYSLVANFALRTFAVTATASPTGAGAISGTGSYPVGAVATLTATPDASHTFTGWSGDLSSAANPVSFTVSSATNLIANFAPASFALTTTAGSGGSVTPGGTYAAGTIVTVAATPDATHRFAGWAGDASGTATSVAVTLDRAKSLQASFAAKSLQTITFDFPGDHGLTSPSFTLTAKATSGLPVSFSLLSGPAILTGNSVEVTGVGPVTIQASQLGDAFFLPANPVNQSFNVIAAATLKYRGQSRTLLRDATTREAPPFVLEKP